MAPTKAVKTPTETPPDAPEQPRRKLLILDGHSLAYRAFFALPDSLVTSAGQITNAVYGFTAMLIKLIGDERPTGVIVAFDKGAPTFRVERYVEYKANRRETPDAFAQQLPLIREVLETLRIPMVALEGFEADDLLATIAKRAVDQGDEVVIISGDRDVLQLVRDGVSVMMTRRGISDIVRYDEAGVFERYGVMPRQWTDFVALKGETSDNLPGVPGIGDKTAAKLIQTYGDIDQVIEHVEELKPKIRAGLTEMADQVRINKELGRLLDDVEIECDPSELRLKPWDDEEVRKLFASLEFRTLYERLRELTGASRPPGSAKSFELTSVATLDDVASLQGAELVAVAWDGGWGAVATDADSAYVTPLDALPSRLGSQLADPGVAKAAHDAKGLACLILEAGGDLEGLEIDTMIAAYLLEPGAAAGYGLADVARRYVGIELDDGTAAPGKKSKQATLDLQADDGTKAARSAAAVRAVAPVLTDHLRNRGMWDLARTLEFPLVGVLARMEHAGVAVDRDYLERLGGEFGETIARLEKRIWELAGEEFNVGSNPQLQRILFEKLDLPRTKRIKTGWSTDHAELLKLAGAHEIVDALIEYREVAKLKSGFTDSLLPLVDPKTGRIHTTYLQASAATGRLASTNPNIQNIPIRGDLGRQIRRAFVAPAGALLMSADYSQIELRVLAHLSGDEGILEAFASDHDFHAAIAAKVHGIDVADVAPRMRDTAKQFSFGIAYGMSAFGVSERLGIDREEAEAFIEAYYAQFPKIRTFLDAQVDQARKEGFTTTMFGRRRYLPELQSSNWRIRAMGERMALNAPIQGSAADIVKKAMIDVDILLRAQPDLGQMLLSVHDELVFEVPDERRDEAERAIRGAMEHAVELQCRLGVSVHLGRNWDEAHA